MLVRTGETVGHFVGISPLALSSGVVGPGGTEMSARMTPSRGVAQPG